MFPFKITKTHNDSYAQRQEYNSTRIFKFSLNGQIVNTYSYLFKAHMTKQWYDHASKRYYAH